MSSRRDYYFRQRVTEAELDEGFEGLEQADFNIVKDILGAGFFISGTNPGTVVEDSPTSLNVQVNQLLAYDQLGRRLSNEFESLQGGNKLGAAPVDVDMSVDEVAASTAVTTPGNEKILTIFVEFERDLKDPRTDGNSNTVFFIRDESVKYNVVQSAEAPVGTAVPPPARTDQLILADITIVNGQTAITNSDIDQSRREDFVFSILHGFSHTESGGDPIPNATTSEGGLLSSTDKTKLDGITFTASGIASLFSNQVKLNKRPNITAPSAISLDVTGSMVGKTPGGSSSVEGVVTVTPNNRVIIRDDDGDAIKDSSGDKIFGRITESGGVWTLTFKVIDDVSGEIDFDMTPFAGNTLQWWIHETFSLENLPTFDSLSLIDQDEVAGGTGFFAQDSGGSPIGNLFSTLKEGSGISFSDVGSGVLEVISSGLFGKALQMQFTEQPNVITTSIDMLWDNSPPTTSDGDQWASISGFTPISSTSKIVIISNALYGANGGQEFTTALFVPSVSSNAVGVAADTIENSARLVSKFCIAIVDSWGTSPFDITARFGRAGAQTVYINAENGNARFGSVPKSYLLAIEIDT